MYKRIFTNQLVEHVSKTIEEPFLLKKISPCQTQASAKKYFDILLQDKNGYIKAKVWELSMDDRYMAYKESVVIIKGQIILNHREEIEIMINRITPLIDYNMADYINGLTQKDTESYSSLLFKYIQKVEHEGYSILLNQFFSTNKESFNCVPATLKQFNNYNGGLLVHTICITSLVHHMMHNLNTYNYDPRYHNNYDSNLLISAALLHGIGTIDLLLPFPEAEKINSSILLSVNELTIIRIIKTISEHSIPISQEDYNLLIHCIHAIYSDDIKPMVKEAQVLKSAYRLQTSISRMDYFMHVNKDEKGSVYDEQLKNYIYISKEKENINGECISGE